ncbi:MAG: hypothetical protein LIP05_14070 [Tannerellaceae bacterium]|nr:hypothetical protein [Tannerellaceae bacterium]
MGNILFCAPDGKQTMPYEREETFKDVLEMKGDICYLELMRMNSFPPLVGMYLIKRSFLFNNQFFFREGVIHEDELWCMNVLILADKVSLLDLTYYLYKQNREGSLMNTNNKEFRIHSLVEISQEIYSWANSLYKQNVINKNAVGYVYARIFLLYHEIARLIIDLPEKMFNLSIFDHILKCSYSKLNYKQQKYVLNIYCLATYLMKCFN